jgi:hypothetical protein
MTAAKIKKKTQTNKKQWPDNAAAQSEEGTSEHTA